MHEFKKLTAKNVGGENYYSIHYFDETDGEIHQGFSSGSLDIISDFLKEFFIKNNDSHEKHAHWIKHKPNEEQMKVYHELGFGKAMGVKSIYWSCSNCNGWGTPAHKYCSNCGRKMDEEVSNDT